jgi:ferredoxin
MAGTVPQHFVCTHDQARKYINAESQFFITVCGCRSLRGGCARSRMDVCLAFRPDFWQDDPNLRKATRDEALALVAEADARGLISRPFRNADDPQKLDGVCFCCPECCHYFNHPEDPFDKGSLCETTRRDECIDCGVCVDACHFGARKLVGGKLVIDRDKCVGCGLCVGACPSGCIEMK